MSGLTWFVAGACFQTIWLMFCAHRGWLEPGVRGEDIENGDDRAEGA